MKTITDSIKTEVISNNGRVVFVAYLKMKHFKKSKPFPSIESEEKAVELAREAEKIEILKRESRKVLREANAADRKENDRHAAKDCKVGQVFVDVWGYDQTNVDFYQVTEVKGQMAFLVPLKKDIVKTGDMTGRVVPQLGNPSGNVLKKRIKFYDGGPAFKSPCSGLITPWDGKSKSVSWYA